jgi:predicted nucleic acid-binding protein
VIVVDTNVVVQLVAGGDRHAAAAALLRRDPMWSATPILMSELQNVLVGFVRRGALTEQQAVAMIEDATAILGGRIAGVSGRRTIAAALECGLTAYDAEFVVLARMLDVPLATLDAAILKGAPDVAVPLGALAADRAGPASSSSAPWGRSATD